MNQKPVSWGITHKHTHIKRGCQDLSCLGTINKKQQRTHAHVNIHVENVLFIHKHVHTPTHKTACQPVCFCVVLRRYANENSYYIGEDKWDSTAPNISLWNPRSMIIIGTLSWWSVSVCCLLDSEVNRSTQPLIWPGNVVMRQTSTWREMEQRGWVREESGVRNSPLSLQQHSWWGCYWGWRSRKLKSHYRERESVGKEKEKRAWLLDFTQIVWTNDVVVNKVWTLPLKRQQ